MTEINGLDERISELKILYQEAERINLKDKAIELLVDINYLEELRELRRKQEPCEDVVSRKTIDQNIYDYAESNGLSYANLKNAILDAPSVTLEQKWIPVSERLPEESDDYLITNIAGDVEMAYFAHPKDYAISKGEWREIWYEDDVIAWMPLPQPYKKEQERIHDKPHIKGNYYDGFKNGVRTERWKYNKIRTAIKKLPITDTAIRLVDEIFDTYTEESEDEG